MAAPKPLFLLCLLVFLLHVSCSSALIYNLSSSEPHGSPLHGMEIPSHLSFNAIASAAESACDHHLDAAGPFNKDARDQDLRNSAAVHGHAGKGEARVVTGPSSLKLHLKHRTAKDATAGERSKKESVKESTGRDILRIETLFKRITEKKNQNTVSRLGGRRANSPDQLSEKAAVVKAPELSGRLMATLESGVALGSGEYFMDVFVGTPPRHFSLIVDTGSDLNWIQCLPCHDCFEQSGPFYNPATSSSYRNVSCGDPRCGLVSSPDPPRPCDAAAAADHHNDHDHSCPYFYWYGDHSNTTGDLALEAFTMNLTTPDGAGTEFRRLDSVIFGCGHWNRGLFHGAAGLLGLGRGPLSFSSQLRSLYGHTFSYCFVDRNSDLSISSKLIFGEDQNLLNHPKLNYTSFVAGKENPADTFYYVRIKDILVGGEKLEIPPDAWELSKDGAGGTIVDSGTTLSYFADPAYHVIKDAFVKKVKYPMVEDFLVLSPCYNVSGVEKQELPEFAIVFGDGAVWNFPVENYFIRLETEEIVCLAVLGTPRSSLSILGNYQQQNFHIIYDMKNSRLGFAPMKCAEV